MLLMVLLVGMFSVVSAAPVRPSVTNVTDVDSIHLLFGTDGQVVSSCVKVTGGWSCDEVSLDSPVDAHLLMDTELIELGQLEVGGAFMNVDNADGESSIAWKQTVEPAVGHGDSLVLIRVMQANSKQAPMLRLRVGGQRSEVGCADDGRFPDGLPNDGQFHCAKVIQTQSFSSEEWALDVLMPTREGEEQLLGTFRYAGKTGLYFATVSVGTTGEANSDAFAVVGPSVLIPGDDPDQVAVPDTPPPGEFEEAKPPVENPSDGFQARGSLSSEILWFIGLSALGFGWWMGMVNRKRRFVFDAAIPLSVSALDDRGPVPDVGSVVIMSATPVHTLSHVAQSLTARRRVLIVGPLGSPPLDVESIYPILQVTDPDQHAIAKLVKGLLSDGKVPPVLLILGMNSVLDTGGASPSPTQDLLDRLAGEVWSAVFVSEDDPIPQGLASWAHDPQAGWSKL